ncbi:MAG: hypothetical protein PHX51_04475 [Clostridia bacterium]|nr:hypothetical protein [Clostridia bacterium]
MDKDFMDDMDDIKEGINKFVGRFVKTIPEGEYEDLSCSGVMTFTGAVKAKKVSVSGSCKAESNLEAEEFRCSGAARVIGELVAEKVSVSGALTVEESMKVDFLSASGALKVEGKLKGNSIRVSGLLKASNVDGETVNVSGDIKCPNEVNCEEFKLDGSAKIDELHAERVVIRLCDDRNDEYGSLPVINSIECTTADIEIVKCKKLCCKDAKIGRYARIEELEYSGEVEIHKRAVVHKLTKV